MIKQFLPFIYHYKKSKLHLLSGVTLAVTTLIAGICLLSLSSWFLSASFIAGFTLITATTFNFFTPGAGVRGLSITRTVSRYFERVVNHDITFKLISQLRSCFYEKLIPLSPLKTISYRYGDLLNRLMDDIETLNHLYLNLAVPFIATILSCVFLFIFCAFFSLSIATAIITVLISAAFILPVVFFNRSRNLGIQISKHIQMLRISILDYFSSREDIIINGADKTYQQKIINQGKKLYHEEFKMACISGLSSGLVTLFIGGGVIWITFLSSALIITQQIDSTIGAMLILTMMATTEIIASLPFATQMLGKVHISATRINEITQQKTNVVFSENKLNILKNTDLCFYDLSYKYPNNSIPVFENLNLHLKENESLTITGYTGCGKSTLINLLARSDLPFSGNIKLNNIDINTFDEQTLRQTISFMPQNVYIFSATLRDNLLLAKPNALDEELYLLLESINLIDNSNKNKITLDTWVGEGGRSLSGGEIQRVGIARVLLQNKPLIALDEPTESLDKHTENLVLKLILNHCKNRTLLIISHKHSVLDYTNRSVSWEQLIAKT